MYKILGLTAVMTASVLTGLTMSNSLKERTKCLRDIHQSAIHIKTDFEYRAPALEDCFKGRGVLFSKAWEYIYNKDYLPENAIKTACREIAVLHKDDRDIINSFAENLKAEDITGQIANIKWLINTLEENIRLSDGEYRTKGKLYRSSGVLAGLGFIIFLL